jgi:TonB family protein
VRWFAVSFGFGSGHLIAVVLQQFTSIFLLVAMPGAGQISATPFQSAQTQMFEGLFGPDGGRRAVKLTVPSFRFIPIYSVQEAGIPVVVRSIHAAYTSDALKARVQGKVTVRAVVREDGTVGDAVVTKSLDAVHGLDDAAVNAAKLWRFQPVLKNGVPVRVRVEMDFAFVLGK